MLARTYRSRNVNGLTGTSILDEKAWLPGSDESLVIDTYSPQFRPCSNNFYNKVRALSNGCESRVAP
jgi:hypothetical protein